MAGRLHALLIGAGPDDCVRDAGLLAAWLRDRMEVAPNDLALLTGPNADVPTLVAALDALENRASPGDQVFVHVSALGTMARRPGARRAEASIVLGDGAILTDLGLAIRLERLARRAVAITVTLDCGLGPRRGTFPGIVESRHGETGDMPSFADDEIAGPDDLVRARKRLDRRIKATSTGGHAWPRSAATGAAVLAACGPGEPAFALAREGCESTGVFTSWLLDALRHLGPGFRFRHLAGMVATRVRSQFVDQHPRFLGPSDAEVFDGRRPRTFTARVAEFDEDDLSLRLDADPPGFLTPGLPFDIPKGPAVSGTTRVWLHDNTATVHRLGRPAPVPGDVAIALDLPSWRFRRRIQTVPAGVPHVESWAAMDQALSRCLEFEDTPGAQPAQADYLVAIDPQSRYILLDPAGTPWPGVEPVPVDESHGVRRFLDRASLLDRCQAMLQLDGVTPGEADGAALSLDITQSTDQPGTRFLRIRNHRDRAWHVALAAIGRGRATALVPRDEVDAAPYFLPPGADHVVQIDAEIAAWAIAIKAIGSVEPFDPHKLDVRARTDSDGSTFPYMRSTLLGRPDDFERFLAAYNGGGVSTYGIPVGPWAIVQAELPTQGPVSILESTTRPRTIVPLPTLPFVAEIGSAIRPETHFEADLAAAAIRGDTPPDLAILERRGYEYEDVSLRLVRLEGDQLLVEIAARWGDAFERIAIPPALRSRQGGSDGLVRDLGRPDGPRPRTADELAGLIGRAMLPDMIRNCYMQGFREIGERQGLRLRLYLFDPETAAVPWESARIDDGPDGLHLGRQLRCPIVRYVHSEGKPAIPGATPRPLRLLIVSCVPRGTAALDDKAERQGIAAALAGLRDSQWVAIDILSQCRLVDLKRRLREREYHLLHFIGHGTLSGPGEPASLMFVGADGGPEVVPLSRFLEAIQGPDLRFVFLNCCQSAHEAGGLAERLVRTSLPAAIGMRRAVADLAAIRFAESFYTYVGMGYAIDAAVADARADLAGQGDDWNLPILFMRSPGGRIF